MNDGIKKLPLKKLVLPISSKAKTERMPILSITAGTGFVSQTEKFGKEIAGAQYKHYSVLNKGDFSYNKGNSKRYPQGCIYRLDDYEQAAVPNVFNCFRFVSKDACPDYYTYVFESGLLNRQLCRFINSGVRNDGLLNLYDDDFYSCEVPVPPLAEQQKIADILSCCDRVIKLKKDLLSEKKKRKKSLMQKLLDPASGFRLPGFSGLWVQCVLGELGNTYSGLSGKIGEDFGHGQAYIPYLNIYANSVIKIDFLDSVYIGVDERQNTVKYGDIFFTTSSETPEEVGMSSVLLADLPNTYLNSFCFGFRLNDFRRLLPEFAAYYFRGQYFRNILNNLAQGATRHNLPKKEFLKSEIMLPVDTKEQQAIADILSVADREIDLLEKELSLWEQKKKSLMQLLLTGIVRVNR